MPSPLIDVHFIRLKTFDRTAKNLLSDDDERELEQDIAEDPQAAPVVSETGGVRTIRATIGQRGKRGGARVLYLGSSTTEATNNMKKTTKARTKTKPATEISMGAAIIEALGEAIAYQAGEKTGATVRTVTARRAKASPAPRYRGGQIARLRRQMRLSQPVFANALNVSSASVKSWEQGVNEPSGAVLRLLQIAERHPEVILEGITRR